MMSNDVFAQSCEKKYTYQFPEGKKEVCFLKEKKLFVTSECFYNEKCHALQSVQSPEFKKIVLKTEELKNGKNPATLLCKKLMGKLILAKTNLGHEEFFCQFEDNSMISTSSQYMIYLD